MKYLTNQYGDKLGPRLPLMTQSGGLTVKEVNATLNYNGKAAAGALSTIQLPDVPILTPQGNKHGSYWGLKQNLVYSRNDSVSITETAGSADCTIVEPDKNLENLFESASGTVKRYIVKLYDTSQNELYGWIEGIAASSNAYTLTVYNNRKLETAQNWVGSISDFDSTKIAKVEIYEYTSSLEFDTGTTLTEEVEMPFEYGTEEERVYREIDNLSNGQFFVDYVRGYIYAKKADTTTSEIITWQTYASNVDTSTGVDGPSGTSSDPMYFIDANPLDTKNLALVQSAVTNQATYSDDYVVDVRNYNSVIVGYKKASGTDTIACKVYGSSQDDGTAPSSVSFHDISQYGISPLDQSAGAASYASNIFASVDTSAMSFLKVEVDRSAGTSDDADYEVYVRASAL